MKSRAMSEGLKLTIERAQHDSVAAYDAAVMLEEECRGQSAFQHFFLRSAHGGYAPAMLRVAGLFLTGQYLVEDDDGQNRQYKCDVAEGLRWIRHAAITGDDTANYLLARCYADGIGVEKNLSKASYYLVHVPFPEQINPYEPAEALVFGSLSHALRDCVQRRQKASIPELGVKSA